MAELNLKPHWKRTIEIVKTLQNVDVLLKCQDGLPVKLIIKDIKQEEIDLTNSVDQ